MTGAGHLEEDQVSRKSPRGRWSWRRWIVWGLIAALVIVVARSVHPFLAINEPVPADVLVVEGWVPDYVLDAAVREFNRGRYTHILVSGLTVAGDPRFPEGSDAARAARHLAASGLNASVLETCPAPATNWNRTSSMARAVRDRLHALGLRPAGVNVVTLGPHARQSRLAYQRMLGAATRIGIISIPKDDYDPVRWWASMAGIEKTTKDLAAWLKEVLFGLRS